MIEKSLDPDRQWHLRVYAQLCVEHLMGIDMDIAESLAGQIKKYELGLQRLEKMTTKRFAETPCRLSTVSMVWDRRVPRQFSECDYFIRRRRYQTMLTVM